MKLHSFLMFALVVLATSPANATTEVAQRDQLRQKFGVQTYAQGNLDGLKIAILDNGFQGFIPHQGLLPDSAELVKGPVDAEAPTPHGLGMAQIVWAMTGQSATGPQFYLVNTNGYSNFKAAIDFVVAQKVDIVLYSEVWTFGDNFDGRGFINAQVNRATSAGVLWINAAGNFGGKVYNGGVTENSSNHFLTFLNGMDTLRFQNQLDENSVTVTLSWSDFKDSETYNATKDLDLFVYDEVGNLVGSSQLIQRGEAPPATGTSNLSSFARETVSLPHLGRGNYQIKVSDRSGNFVSTDRLRVVLEVENPDSVIFTDHTDTSELLPPADNASVLSVGEQTNASSHGADVLIDDATISFTNGMTTRGTSNAAAILTGVVTMMKANCARLDFNSLSQYASHLTETSPSSSADLLPLNPSQVNSRILALIPAGGSIKIATNGHLVILSPVDPLQLPLFRNLRAYRRNPDDVLTYQPITNAWYGYSNIQRALIRAPLIEFRQVLVTPGTWKTPANSCPL